MIKGARYQNDDIIYTVFKKHRCPACGEKLKLIKLQKIVNSESPEAKDYDFSLGARTSVRGDMKFYRPAFRCRACGREFEVEEIKKAEGIVEKKIIRSGLGEKKTPLWVELGILLALLAVATLVYALLNGLLS